MTGLRHAFWLERRARDSIPSPRSDGATAGEGSKIPRRRNRAW